MTTTGKIVIVGGGVTGLTAGVALLEAGLPVHLVSGQIPGPTSVAAGAMWGPCLVEPWPKARRWSLVLQPQTLNRRSEPVSLDRRDAGCFVWQAARSRVVTPQVSNRSASIRATKICGCSTHQRRHSRCPRRLLPPRVSPPPAEHAGTQALLARAWAAGDTLTVLDLGVFSTTLFRCPFGRLRSYTMVRAFPTAIAPSSRRRSMSCQRVPHTSAGRSAISQKHHAKQAVTLGRLDKGLDLRCVPGSAFREN
ncbi:FAD-dependent oxidoreductase [Streptomyces sp. NPDC005423]|uniref:FAD-dependent oxidoreductase n=1 Tax=Streptomyces sp. NPDC005423 TaxID=3155343 RepID=UPI0033BCCD90